MEELPSLIQTYFRELRAERALLHTHKLQESLRALGFTFSTPQVLMKFKNKRIQEIKDESKPHLTRLFLDYGKTGQVLLAEYNSVPEIDKAGQIIFQDKFYELNSHRRAKYGRRDHYFRKTI